MSGACVGAFNQANGEGRRGLKGSGLEVDGLEDALLLRQVRLGDPGHVVHDEHQALALDIQDEDAIDLARALVEAPQPAPEFTKVAVPMAMSVGNAHLENLPVVAIDDHVGGDRIPAHRLGGQCVRQVVDSWPHWRIDFSPAQLQGSV